MTAIIAAACLTACSETDNNPVNPDSQQTIKAPDTMEPTDDQLAVRINANMPAAVLSSFDDTSLGAALVRRMSMPSATVTDDTKLVLFKPSGNKLTDEDWSKLGRLFNRGGYIALEKPTLTEALATAITLAIKATEEFRKDLAKNVIIEGKDEDQALKQQASSPFVQKLQNRVNNAAAATRAVDLDDVIAEVFIFNANGYYAQVPYENRQNSSNQSGNDEKESEPTTVMSDIEYNSYQSGLMADAVAEWLNSKNDGQQAAAHSQALTRSSSDAINSLMDCSDEFTYDCNLPWLNAYGYMFQNPNRVTERYLIWGAHNFNTNTDYYYVEQKTTLKMGGRGKNSNSCIYWGPDTTPHTWYDASNYKGSDGTEYNYYYGSWLHKYETSMNLTGDGKGQIRLEEALPYTDNTEGSKSIAIGTFESTSDVVGIMGGVTVGEQPSIDFGGYYEYGVSRGTNFTMTTTSTKKEFPVVKNTENTKVTWTYEAPEYLEPHYYYDNGHHCHSECPDILCNDANTQNSICWSVKNPVGSYTLNLTSHRRTRCLLLNKDYNCTWNAWNDKTYHHTFIEPNRAQQNWYMDISVDETEGEPAYNIKGTLIENIKRSFPKTYTNEFTIADKTASSTDMIESIVNAQAKVFNSQKRTLEEHAKSLYIKKFTIRWTSDSPELSRVVYKYEVNAQ